MDYEDQPQVVGQPPEGTVQLDGDAVIESLRQQLSDACMQIAVMHAQLKRQRETISAQEEALSTNVVQPPKGEEP